MDFNYESLNWDTEYRVKRAKIIAEEIKSKIPLSKSYSALDFGCGTGLISFHLNDQFNQITLIDTSIGMIDKLKEKITEFNVSNMNAIHLDINKQSKDIKKTFDVIYTSMALHHIDDITTTLTNLYQLLNQNGYLCIVDLDEEDGKFHQMEEDFHGHNGFNQTELKTLLETIGFKNVDSHLFFHGTKAIKDEKIDYALFLMVGKK